MTSLLTIILITAAILAVFVIFLVESWRWNIAGLAIQYLVVFLLVSQIWPLGLAAIKLVAGWMACAVFTISRKDMNLKEPLYYGRSVWAFRILLGILILLVVFLITPSINTWIPAPTPFLMVGLILISMGLMQLGITQQPLKTVLGLLTLLSGFEAIYSSLEGSALLAGILAVITLALGIVGSYLAGIFFEKVEY